MKKLILIYFCCSGLQLIAQEDRQVIIVDRNSERSSERNRPKENRMPRRLVEHMNVFKFDPIRMAIGEINFAYERVLDDPMSLEIELGPTVSNLGRNRFFVDQSMTTKNSSMGVFTSVALKFYPLDGRPALNQLYISPKFKYRRYNEMIEGNSSSALPSIKGFTNEAIFTFNFGYQQWLANNFSFDYYFGIGIGSYASTTYQASSEFVNNEWQETWLKQNENYSRFVATIGMKVGIGK
jgi:hypothetical protein